MGEHPAELQQLVGKHIGNAEPSSAVLAVAAADVAVLAGADVAVPVAGVYEAADAVVHLEALHHLIHS